MHGELLARFIICTIYFLFMELRICLGIVGIMAFLFCSVSAAGISLNDVIGGGSSDAGISVPQLPPPEGGSVLQRKILDSQPHVFKTSDRLLHEAEISRDLANKEFEACMVKTTEDLNNLEDTKQHGLHWTVDQTKELWLHSPDPGFYTDEARNLCTDAITNYDEANKQYRAALAATDDKDYERQARIFDSAAGIYRTVGNTKAEQQVENAALAARAQAAAQKISLPLSSWIAVFAIISGLILVQRKKN